MSLESLAVFIVAATVLWAARPNVPVRAHRAAATAEVKIANFSFGPGTLTVAVGTTVIWTNHDDLPHTIVSTDGVFRSKVMDRDEQFSYAFTKSGTFSYFCSIHPKMTGKVVVQ